MPDPDLVKETAEILLRPHLEIPAEGRGGQMTDPGDLFQHDVVVKIVQQELIDGIKPVHVKGVIGVFIDHPRQRLNLFGLIQQVDDREEMR